MEIQFSDVLYKVNRDHRKGDLDSHLFLIYELKEVRKFGDLYYIIYAVYNGKYFGNVKEEREEKVVEDWNKNVLYIVSKEVELEYIQKLLDEVIGHFSFNKINEVDNLIDLLQGEVINLEISIKEREKKVQQLKLDIEILKTQKNG